MLAFLALRGQLGKKQEAKEHAVVCRSVNDAWNLAAELGSLAAQQTGEGFSDMEVALKIKDPKAADTIGRIGAKYAAVGMSFSDSASLMQTELEKVAKTAGCKLALR